MLYLMWTHSLLTVHLETHAICKTTKRKRCTSLVKEVVVVMKLGKSSGNHFGAHLPIPLRNHLHRLLRHPLPTN